MDRLEKLCAEKGLRMTEQRKVIARVLSLADDHPDAEELHSRANAVDKNISLATVYRTVKLLKNTASLKATILVMVAPAMKKYQMSITTI